MKSIKQYNLGGFSISITDGREVRAEMASDSMIQIPSFIKTGLDIQVVLRL
jgi:hypothetical protein